MAVAAAASSGAGAGTGGDGNRSRTLHNRAARPAQPQSSNRGTLQDPPGPATAASIKKSTTQIIRCNELITYTPYIYIYQGCYKR
jgi:hypothetical protein